MPKKSGEMQTRGQKITYKGGDKKMKKRFIGILLAVLLVFSVGSVGIAGINMEGELNYEIGEAITDSYTQVVANLAPEPFDIKLTWRRDWIPTLGDSVALDAGISLGNLRLGYTRELLEPDVGIASLKLTNDPLEIKYARLLDGLDPGILTLDLTLTPFKFTYTRLFGEDSLGTIFVRFEKSF